MRALCKEKFAFEVLAMTGAGCVRGRAVLRLPGARPDALASAIAVTARVAK